MPGRDISRPFFYRNSSHQITIFAVAESAIPGLIIFPTPMRVYASFLRRLILCTSFLSTIQWLAGLIAFLVPQMPQRNRACYLPVHVSFGGLLYLLIIGTCVSGITQKNIFSKAYSSFLPREMIGNALGVCIVLFGAIVFYLISHPAYKRVEVVSPERRALNE
ncbi:uncharacterized protein DEA37_0015028 [Paragonimus westermani]|uniref:Cytochrome b561 domain-containing protein n=1 Tax=Paragonimus westermani TaxID=34504 RepID=A0A5J4NPT2_9TREM|nr:uncharacterized protein DEA37_0015028 [Paragonimus westermani]